MEERRQGQGKGLVLGDGAEARPCRARSGGGVEGRHRQGGELDLSVVVIAVVAPLCSSWPKA